MTAEPNPVDKHVGERVRMRRIMVGMSQDSLGKKLGLTFQQIQKYGKGINRIGASRLQQISEILDVPVAFLFAGLPGAKSGDSEHILPNQIVHLMGTALGQRLVEGFGRISDQKLRSHLAN